MQLVRFLCCLIAAVALLLTSASLLLSLTAIASLHNLTSIPLHLNLLDSPIFDEGTETNSRGYSIEGVCRWYAEKADVVLLFLDPGINRLDATTIDIYACSSFSLMTCCCFTHSFFTSSLTSPHFTSLSPHFHLTFSALVLGYRQAWDNSRNTDSSDFRAARHRAEAVYHPEQVRPVPQGYDTCSLRNQL
jgi:hypothetical protein